MYDICPYNWIEVNISFFRVINNYRIYNLTPSLPTFRTDELKRQYTGALCGLGFCPDTGMSLFPDHDIELIFDSLIAQDDIAAVSV